MDKERFSMLLLEPGEIYFEDYSTVWLFYESEKLKENQSGRLKLCSKSLVFEPRDRVKPLIKIQFKECMMISQCDDKMNPSSQNILSVKCKQYAEMMEGNVIAPYKFKSETVEFLFLLNYASIADCIQQMNQLQRASTLHACEQNSMVATISHSRYCRMRFDPLWLDDLYDNILLEINADRVSPLVQNPGKIVLTANTLFFQPCNNIEPHPVLTIKTPQIKRIFKRRFLLRQVGLEIYNDTGCEIPHIYLAMRNQGERDDLFSKLMELPKLNLDNMEQNEMTMQWQNGVLSNYDYLLYLNCLADRTKNDLTQYPVFPWVINDYTAPKIDLDDFNTYRDLRKPIGALDSERLGRLKDRYEEMAPPKFLYGSHYSAPGLVLFYLVRKCPHYMLCLQNGRFDHPDRMFNALSDVYRNCLSNMSDFKELIPEFYDVENNGDFLVNKFGIQFGYRHNGTKVEDVQLPPWAQSPKHFVETMRQALESDYVSQNLHGWIDLIFGYKQNGEQAKKADNIFFHLCYEGSINLDDIADMNERHALEVQIMEFGQIPKQIFKSPHVKRILNTIHRPLSKNTHQVEQKSPECEKKPRGDIKKLQEYLSFHSHKDGVSCVLISDDAQRVISVGKDSLLKVYSLESKKQTRSVSVGTMPLSSCVQMDDNTVIVGSWDNNIVMYDLEYGRVVDSFRAHDDSVSCLVWSAKESMLVSGGWDCAVRVWSSLSGFGKGTFRPLQGLKAELDHDAKITCLALNRDCSVLITGTDDGDVFLWNTSTRAMRSRLPQHADSVSGACFISDDKRFVTCSIDGELRVTDITVNSQVFSKQLPEGLSCMTWDGKDLLCLGGVKGTLFIWNLQNVVQLLDVKVHQGAVNSIAIGPQCEFIATGSEDHHVKVWNPTDDS